MRLTDEQIQAIRQLTREVTGEQAQVRVFGSRLDDTLRGGDLDLLLELPEPVDNPALMAAQLSARISRALQGRKVDVLLSAPNLLHLPIHDRAFKEGQLLWPWNPCWHCACSFWPASCAAQSDSGDGRVAMQHSDKRSAHPSSSRHAQGICSPTLTSMIQMSQRKQHA